MIRLGVCTSFDHIDAAAKIGFDFIECSLTGLSELTDEQFEACIQEVHRAPIRVEACNGMLPGCLKVTGENADPGEIRAYLDRMLPRARRLGTRVIVFGSGAARGVPDGFPAAQAWRQIAEFLRMANDAARENEIDIAIEPLRRVECNILNFVSEGAILSSVLNLDHIFVLGDTYHMEQGGEPYGQLTFAGDLLRHVHVSHSLGASGRDYPAPGDGGDYQALFTALKEGGYQGRVSIEAGCKDFCLDGARALHALTAARAAAFAE